MVVTGGRVLGDGIRLSISEVIDPPWKHGDSINITFYLRQSPPISNLFIEATAGRTYCRVSGVGELYNLLAISRSDLRRCRHVELHRAKNSLDRCRRMVGSDPRGDNPVHVGRHGSRRKPGSQSADNHDDAAVHGGNVRSSHWRGNRHRVVAEPPAGCQRERLKW